MRITKTTIVVGFLTLSTLAITAMFSIPLAALSAVTVGLLLTADTDVLKEAFGTHH
ncbi:MAG: hypothetical protein ABGZ17_32015 [Planctomycetaceae bacterium]